MEAKYPEFEIVSFLPDAMRTNKDVALKLWVVLSRAHEAVAAHSRDDIARRALSPTAFASLEALYHKGPMLVGELQRKILISSGGITYVIDQLAAKGLVTRRPCEGDRRAVYAELTPAGKKLLDRIFPLHAATIEAAMAGLTRREQEEATHLLRKLGLAAEESRSGTN
jgi:MarR family 2-MHQ and catechol resistance regulon transcriptional repressor